MKLLKCLVPSSLLNELRLRKIRKIHFKGKKSAGGGG